MDKKIVCIVQARMGSTRLPGKVLLPLAGKAVLLHAIDRILESKHIQQIIVATTVNPKDDVIVKLLTDYHPRVIVERGLEDDVLDRFYQVAKKHNIDIIVRLMGENPFTDPDVIDEVVQMVMKEDIDYAANSLVVHTFPRGLDVEAFTFATLEKCWKEGHEPLDREHVTVYIKRCKEKFKTKSYENPVDYSHYRLTIDEESDYLLAQALYDRLIKRKKPFRMEDIISLLENNPEISAINTHVKHKNPQY